MSGGRCGSSGLMLAPRTARARSGSGQVSFNRAPQSCVLRREQRSDRRARMPLATFLALFSSALLCSALLMFCSVLFARCSCFRREHNQLETRDSRMEIFPPVTSTAHRADRKADADAERNRLELLKDRRLREKQDTNASKLAAYKSHKDRTREDTMKYRQERRAAEEERRRHQQEIEAEKLEQEELERMEKRRKMEKERAFKQKFHGRRVNFNW